MDYSGVWRSTGDSDNDDAETLLRLTSARKVARTSACSNSEDLFLVLVDWHVELNAYVRDRWPSGL